MLAGCAGGLWPSLREDKADVEKAREGGTLKDALAYAEAVRVELDNGNNDAGNVKRGGAYAATAIGVGSGAAVLYNAGDAILRGLTVAAAAVVGIDGVATPGAQLKIFEAGATAVECVIRAARDQATAGKNLFLPGRPSTQTKVAGEDGVISMLGLNLTTTDDAKPASQAVRTAANNFKALGQTLPTLRKDVPPSVNSVGQYRAREYLLSYNAEVSALANYVRKLGNALDDLPELVIASTAEIRRKVQRQLNAATPDLGEIADARRKAMVTMASELIAARDKMHPEEKKPPPTAGAAPGAKGAMGVLQNEGAARLEVVMAFAANVKEAGEPLAKTFDACTDSATVQAQRSGNDKPGKPEKPETTE